MRTSVTFIAAGCVAALLAGCASNSPGATSAAADPAAGTAVPAPTSSAAATASAIAATPTKAPSSHPGTKHTATHPGTAPASFGYPTTSNPQALIDAARKAAAADHREVLIDFGASWCGNCVAMDKDFHTPQVQAVVAASYHLVQIDADHDHGTLMRYDTSGSYALPVLIVLSPNGTIRVDTDKTGNPSFGQSGFLAWLKKWAA